MKATATDETSVGIFDKISNQMIDILKIALIECAADTHIPELFEIFGRENFLKFLDIFSGCTIVCPHRAVIDKCIRDVTIYLKVERALEGTKTDAVKYLASQYSVSPGVIRQIHSEMVEKLKRYTIK